MKQRAGLYRSVTSCRGQTQYHKTSSVNFIHLLDLTKSRLDSCQRVCSCIGLFKKISAPPPPPPVEEPFLKSVLPWNFRKFSCKNYPSPWNFHLKFGPVYGINIPPPLEIPRFLNRGVRIKIGIAHLSQLLLRSNKCITFTLAVSQVLFLLHFLSVHYYSL
jgi:hypothetical protein